MGVEDAVLECNVGDSDQFELGRLDWAGDSGGERASHVLLDRGGVVGGGEVVQDGEDGCWFERGG